MRSNATEAEAASRSETGSPTASAGVISFVTVKYPKRPSLPGGVSASKAENLCFF